MKNLHVAGEWACRVHLCVSTCPAQSTGLVNVVSTVKAPVAQSFMQVTGLLFVFIAHELFTVLVEVGFSVHARSLFSDLSIHRVGFSVLCPSCASLEHLLHEGEGAG